MSVLFHLDLGTMAYDEALEIQRRLLAVVQGDPQKAFLLTVEHSPAVITLGRNARAGNVLASTERLETLGVQVRNISRGGDVTLHSPGQLVAYPILKVDRHGGVRRFVHTLEEAIIRLLAENGIAAGRVDGLTGVWTGCEKIAAIGIGVSRWVTYHGLALNVSTDLSHFDLIVPCGLSGKRVTSMSRLLAREITIDEVKPATVRLLASTLCFESVRTIRIDDIDLGGMVSPLLADHVQQPTTPARRLPPWLTRDKGPVSHAPKVRQILRDLNLATVCADALCPNRPECYARGTATFLIMGRSCTRSCGFCAVAHASPSPLNSAEPENLAQAALRMQLRHVVITSVTRDDLPDGGAGHFAACIAAVRAKLPNATIEVLTPDFGGNVESVRTVVEAGPSVFNHNIETVRRLYSSVRPQADYDRSLDVLKTVKSLAIETGSKSMLTKSGIMVGLGERDDEVMQAMRDLRAVGCDILTIGQYLAPSPRHVPVAEYIPPEQFETWRQAGLEMGFSAVASGPFVRSSYNAAEIVDRVGWAG